MKISDHLADAIAWVIDMLTLAYLTIGTVIAVFAGLQPAADLGDEDDRPELVRGKVS